MINQPTTREIAQRTIDRECTCTRCREAARREQLEAVKRAIAGFDKGSHHANLITIPRSAHYVINQTP